VGGVVWLAHSMHSLASTSPSSAALQPHADCLPSRTMRTSYIATHHGLTSSRALSCSKFPAGDVSPLGQEHDAVLSVGLNCRDSVRAIVSSVQPSLPFASLPAGCPGARLPNRCP
jgi:hypothetical protein